MSGFSDPVQRLCVDERTNCIEKAVVLKITTFLWTGPETDWLKDVFY